MLVHPSDASEMGRGIQPVRKAGAKRWDWEVPGSAASRQAALSIRTSRAADDDVHDSDETEEEEEESTTPTAREARIPDRLPCPPAPRKKRPPLLCVGGGGEGGANKEFFCCPPDLEAVFARRKQQPAK